MRSAWMIVTRQTTRFRTAIFIVALTLSLLLPILSNSSIAYADTVVQAGNTWLTSLGGGVDIMSGGDGSHNCVSVSGAPGQSQCNNTAGQVYAGDKWQCVEMINRLYLAKGWITTTWWGNGSSIINDVPNHPGLTYELQDHISNVNVGDVVTETHGTDGHAGVINSIDANGTIHIKSQNADLDSQASIQQGTSLSAGNAHYVLSGWIGYSIQAIVHHPTSPPPPPPPSYPLRIGVLGTDGTLNVKEGDLSAQWTNEYGGVSQGIVSGSLIGELSNGTFQVKQPNLSSQWTWEYGNVQSAALSDASGSTPLRIGVLTNGLFLVKEGSLTAPWTNEWTPTGTPVVGYLSGSRIGVLTSDGTLYVKDGGLDAQWSTEATGASKAVLSGSLIGVIYPDNSFYVKQGGLDATWTWEYGGVQTGLLSDATSSTPLRIGVIGTDGTLWVKEGSLTAQWTWEYGGVGQAALSGNLIGEDSGGNFQVKQGGLDATWTWEYGWVASGTLWSPN